MSQSQVATTDGSPTALTTTIRGVTVVDTRTGDLTPNMDITITGPTITSITPTQPARSTSDIDARGKFAVPGYLEMHAHPLDLKDPTGSLELMLANGITGFRQMAGSPELLRRRAAGTLPLPEDSPALLALPGSLLLPLNAGTAKAATAAVAEQHAAGADFIKVAVVTPEVFFAAHQEANRLGIPILGHLPVNIDVIEASKRGLKCIEHLGPGLGILAACSTDEQNVRAALAAQRQIKLPPIKIPFMESILKKIIHKIIVNPTSRTSQDDINLLQHTIDTFDEAKCEALAEQFRTNGTWQCPTLIRERTSELCDAEEFRTDPNLRYVTPRTVKEWQSAADTFAHRTPQAKATFRAAYALQLRLTKLFDEAGVKMTAGSDACGACWEVAGYALHQEFDELARAGLSPLRVLQMATLNGAEFLNSTATMGTVEPGKNADLVLLDANPIEDVKNLHRISGVVRAGRHYSPTALNAIKQRVADARSVL